MNSYCKFNVVVESTVIRREIQPVKCEGSINKTGVRPQMPTRVGTPLKAAPRLPGNPIYSRVNGELMSIQEEVTSGLPTKKGHYSSPAT